MTEINLEPVYKPEEVEERRYRFWLEGDYFRARGEGQETFTIVIPPPNVTGTLHMGHALDNTIQDVLIRWKRMQGYDTLWLPGTDHAGIATQIQVEEHLEKEGLSRKELGREGFLKKAWEWKEEYRDRIINQLQKLGVSCDWSRERFTMDAGCSRAVREVFVSLYRRGLIYRGDYMINWCPRCRTALSDIEVEHEEEDSSLTHLRYPVVDGEGYVVVATTRPETMLGDTGVAVHPEDERYRHLTGKKVLLPLMNREIPVVADREVDPEFGTGAVKVTPAHDPNDLEIGRRHGLQIIQVIGDQGFMTENAGDYSGLERYQCRKKVVEDLKQQELIERIEDYRHAPGSCQRCYTVVEPLISRQWFVKMKSLAEPAARVVREGQTGFVPDRFSQVYLNWMDNIRDWCISRQIWWGHQIPAWYCSCGEIIVDYQDPDCCPSCGESRLERDPDVLDTWFSSALWPFSTLGWPDETADLKRYFPTDVLVTGYDIIYFWVARMIVMSLAFMEEVPFHTVYIHGLVRDAYGRKMSKSLGNGVDPLEIIDQYGADTLRFTLITAQAPGNDQRFRQESVEASRNFSNKLWNVSRFILMNLEEDERPDYQDTEAILQEDLTRADKWILHKYNRAVREVTRLLNQYELGEAARSVYEFMWNDFCDWYVEMSKQYLYQDGDNPDQADQTRCKSLLLYLLDGTLRLLHPFMPFISEEVWGYLPSREEALVAASWPEHREELEFPREADEIELIQEAIRSIRRLRSEVQLSPGQKSPAVIRPVGEKEEIFREEALLLIPLAAVGELTVDSRVEKPGQALTEVIGEGVEIFLPLQGLVDLDKEIGRLEKDLKEVRAELEKVKKKLSNQGFLQKAPGEVIEKVKGQEEELQGMQEKLNHRLQELKEMK